MIYKIWATLFASKKKKKNSGSCGENAEMHCVHMPILLGKYKQCTLYYVQSIHERGKYKFEQCFNGGISGQLAPSNVEQISQLNVDIIGSKTPNSIKKPKTQKLNH